MISISRRGFLIINGRPLTKFEAACAVAEALLLLLLLIFLLLLSKLLVMGSYSCHILRLTLSHLTLPGVLTRDNGTIHK